MRQMLNHYGDLVGLATVGSAWAAMALGMGTAALCWDRKEKLHVWFSRGMLSIACVAVGYAIGVALLTAGRALIIGVAH